MAFVFFYTIGTLCSIWVLIHLVKKKEVIAAIFWTLIGAVNLFALIQNVSEYFLS